jgi:hypothetical protein
MELNMAISPEDRILLKEATAFNAKHAGGSRMIRYKDMEILAPMCDIAEALDALESINRQERRIAMASVRAEIERTLPRVRHKNADQNEFMGFCHDVVIWFANEVLTGKETLSVN